MGCMFTGAEEEGVGRGRVAPTMHLVILKMYVSIPKPEDMLSCVGD